MELKKYQKEVDEEDKQKEVDEEDKYLVDHFFPQMFMETFDRLLLEDLSFL